MAHTETVTFYNFTITTADGKTETSQYKSESQYDEAVKLAAADKSTLDVTKVQAFIMSHADALSDIATMIPNEEVAVGYFDYGLTLEQHNWKRDFMRDPDEPQQENPIDLLTKVQEPKQKRAADPQTKLRRSLLEYYRASRPGKAEPTIDELNAVLAALDQQRDAAMSTP